MVWSSGTISCGGVEIGYDVSGGGVNNVDMIVGLYSSGSGYSCVGYVKGLSSIYQPFFFVSGSVVNPDNFWFLRLHAGFFGDFGGR